MQPKIPLPTDDQLSADIRATLANLPPVNVFRMMAEDISRDICLSDEALAAILTCYGVRQATELILCCSYFNMLSRFLESTRVELESTPTF